MEFAKDYLPNMSNENYQSFLVGSVYIDSLPRKKFHKLENVLYTINQETTNTTRWWFKIGMLLHLSVDVFGHFGNENAFLPLGIPKHYFSEFVVCSAIKHTKGIEIIDLTDESKEIIKELGSSMNYKVYNKVIALINFLGKMPFDSFLGSIEADTCIKCNSKKYSINNLFLHVEGIKCAMWDTLVSFMKGELTDEKLGQFVRREITNIPCCY